MAGFQFFPVSAVFRAIALWRKTVQQANCRHYLSQALVLLQVQQHLHKPRQTLACKACARLYAAGPNTPLQLRGVVVRRGVSASTVQFSASERIRNQETGWRAESFCPCSSSNIQAVCYVPKWSKKRQQSRPKPDRKSVV